MAIVKMKPTSPGRRHDVRSVNKPFNKGTLLKQTRKSSSDNNNDLITTLHIGGESKQHYKIIDFKCNRDGIAPKELITNDDKLIPDSDTPIFTDNLVSFFNMLVNTIIHGVEINLIRVRKWCAALINKLRERFHSTLHFRSVC